MSTFTFAFVFPLVVFATKHQFYAIHHSMVLKFRYFQGRKNLQSVLFVLFYRQPRGFIDQFDQLLHH
jgi:hypothetical protein